VNNIFHVFNRFLVVPKRSPAYRPEIDGLRAVAVVAVLINHLNQRFLPGGFLGVDIFFVISGYVVTSSLMAREDGSRWQFLARFYGRRVRRLLPALVVNIAVVSVLFSLFASPLDDFYAPIMRTGTTAIFGVSNLYLLKQGTGYFAGDNQFNIFMHTWSLGVEEQFYLVWPAILLLCGLGVAGAAGGLRRLKIVSLLLVAVSLALFVGLSLKGQSEQAFFLTPARFWELAAGCGAYLLHRGGGSARDLGRKLAFPGLRGPLSLVLLLAMVGLLLLPESWRLATTMAVAAITALLLILVQPTSGVGRLLCHPVSLTLGAMSYSLYLWHWPVIVLARWTIGLTALTLLPVLALIALCTILSYRIERLFRYSRPSGHGLNRTWVLYPVMTVLVSAVSLALQGPLMGRRPASWMLSPAGPHSFLLVTATPTCSFPWVESCWRVVATTWPSWPEVAARFPTSPAGKTTVQPSQHATASAGPPPTIWSRSFSTASARATGSCWCPTWRVTFRACRGLPAKGPRPPMPPPSAVSAPPWPAGDRGS
jgi:peptidoglycan/LPS O-acetylase OafA/YrhL